MQRTAPARALLLAALLVLGATLLAPSAHAQKPRPVVELRADPALATIAPGEQAAVEVEVRYLGAVPEAGALRFLHDVDGTASWASFVVEPAEETLSGAGQKEIHVRFRVLVRVADHAVPGGTVELPLVTRVDPTLAHDAGEGSASLTIQVRGNASARGGSSEHAHAAPVAATPPAPHRGDDAIQELFPWPRDAPEGIAQSRRAPAFSGGEFLVVALGGAAGAYAGLRLWRRLA